METFGIWNLLKSLLTSESQNISEQTAQSETSPQQSKDSEAVPPGKTPLVPTEQPEEKANACEEYLLRHERLTNGRKR